jgi:hypothetical protein
MQLVTTTRNKEFNFPTLTPGTKYEWEIAPILNYNGTESCVTTGNFTTPITCDLVVTKNTNSLTWTTTNGDSTYYKVYFGEAGQMQLVSTIRDKEFNFPTLTPGTNYVWEIAPILNYNGAEGACVRKTGTFTTTHTCDITVTGTSPLTWTSANGNAASYDIYFGAENLPPQPITITGKTHNSTLAPGTTYLYKIVLKINGEEKDCERTGSFTTAPACVTNTYDGGANLTWSLQNGAATSYKVHFGTSTNPSWLTTVTGNTYAPTLASGTKYYWKIVPVANGVEAEDCDIWNFTTTVPCATLTAPNNGATSNGTLTWENNPAYTYNVHYGTTTPPA